MLRSYCETSGRFIDFDLLVFVFTDKDGKPVFYLPGGIGFNNKTRYETEYLQKHLRTVYQIVCFAFTFAHCKNVTTIDSTASLKPPDKIERRLKLPAFRRYTLKINGRQTASPDGDGTGTSPAYHLCRGHFATYTPERPLFGRLVGKFWIPAHTKGNKSRGEVVKDYSA